MDTFRISIITPVFNRECTISRCIESVISQQYNNYEFILIDDASTDSTRNIISGYLKHTELKLIKLDENRGPSYARNRGIEKATGDFSMLLDSDDYLEKGALDILNSFLNQFNSFSHFLFRVKTNNVHITDTTKEVLYKDWLSELVRGDFTHVLRTIFFKQNKFDEKYWAMEGLSWFRIYKNSQPQLYINNIIVNVDNSIKNSISNRLKSNYNARINDIYSYYHELIRLYKQDITKYRATKLVRKALLFGIAAQQYNDNRWAFDNFDLSKFDESILKLLNNLKLSIVIRLAIRLNSILKRIFLI